MLTFFVDFLIFLISWRWDFKSEYFSKKKVELPHGPNLFAKYFFHCHHVDFVSGSLVNGGSSHWNFNDDASHVDSHVLLSQVQKTYNLLTAPISQNKSCSLVSCLICWIWFWIVAYRESTPTVSYVKALDIWMVALIFFVFLTLFQFVLLVWCVIV